MTRKLDGTFIQSGTVTVTQLAGELNDTSNASYNQANNAYAQANAARSDANTTFATVNTTFGTVNTSLGAVNSTFGTVNTAVTNAHDQANSARGQANTAYGQANAAYGAANTRLSTSGGSISGDLSITGNLTVQGNATTINVSNLSVNDSMILLSTNAVGDSNDIGFIGHFDRGATATHAGLIRKATQNQFYLFDNYEVEPTNNVIDVTGNNFRVGNLRLGIINANSFVTSAGLNVTDQANAAFAAANNRVLKAGDTMTGQLNISAGGLLVTGNVGIGTTNPRGNLDVSSGNLTGSQTRSIHLGYSAADFYGFRVTNINDAGATYAGTFRIQRGIGSSWSDDVVVNDSGNVGIGTTNPQGKLTISNAGAEGIEFITSGGVGNGPYFNAYNRSTSRYVPFTYYANTHTFYANTGTTRALDIDISGNIGIGATSPGHKLDVTGSIRASSQLISTVATGTAPLAVSSTTAVTNLNADLLDGIQGSSFLRSDASATNSVDLRSPIFYDSQNTAYYCDPNAQSYQYRLKLANYAGSVSSGAVVSFEIQNNGGTGDANVAAMAFHCSGAYATHMHLRADGYLGVGGWSASTWRWYVNMTNGDMTAAGNVTAYSDPRLKTNIRKIDSALDKVLSLNGVKFQWIESSVIGNPGKEDYGILSNEVAEIAPELVVDSVFESEDGDKYKTVAYDKLVPFLIEAIKELKAEIDELKKNN